VGGSVSCPACGAAVAVPTGEDVLDVELADEAVTPQRAEPAPKTRRPAKRARYDEDDEDDRRERRTRWKPCPKCGAQRSEKVTWTVWGSFYGPAMFSHVRCADCGYGYNGRTGKSNFWPAFFMVLIPALGLVAVIGGLALWIWYVASGGMQ
jgi:hypothetical protein